MATGERNDAVVAAIAPVLSRLGLELFDVELVGANKTRTLRVLVDRGPGVANLDLAVLSAASEAVSQTLDSDAVVESVLRGPYTLEVSSPGLERPLRLPRHFTGAIGATVSVKSRGDDGAVRRRGVVVAADDDGVDFDFDGTHVRLAYDEIIQARTVFEWGAKPGPKRARTKKTKSKTKKQQEEVVS